MILLRDSWLEICILEGHPLLTWNYLDKSSKIIILYHAFGAML